MAFRVVQWATGGVGRAVIQGVLSHPDLEMVGCWVHSDDKAGRDVGELIVADPRGDDSVDVERLGVIATPEAARESVMPAVGDEHLDPAWSLGPEGERFEVEVTGDPSTTTIFHGLHPESIAVGLVRNPGIVATALHCVNAVPYVCAAEPGVRTYLDLPPVAGRAAPHLS